MLKGFCCYCLAVDQIIIDFLPSFFPPTDIPGGNKLAGRNLNTHTRVRARARSHKQRKKSLFFIVLRCRCLVHSLRSSLGSSDELSLPSFGSTAVSFPRPVSMITAPRLAALKAALSRRSADAAISAKTPPALPTPLRPGVKTLFTYSGWIGNPKGRNRRIKIHRLSTAISVYKIFTA